MRLLKTLKNIYNSKFGIIIKIIISLIILILFFKSVNIEKLQKLASYISVVSLIVLLLLTVFRNYLGAIRFKSLVAIKKKISILEIMKQYFVASLFNNFLPTALGGDGVRLLMVAKCGISKTESGVMIFTERLIGFYALIFISFFSSFFWDLPLKIFLLISSMMLVYSILIILFLFLKIKIKTKNIFLNKVFNIFNIMQLRKSLIYKVFSLSIIYQIISIYVSFYVANIINVETSILPFLTLVPLVWFFTMIPISFGGVGIREISFAYLLSFVGISKEQALIISLGTYLTLVASGVIGAVIFITRKIKNDNIF